MDMRASRRLEVDCKPKKQTKEQHLSTFHLPYERTVQAVPYYNKRKRQLKSKYLMYNSKHQANEQGEQEQPQKGAEDPFEMDMPLAQMITNVTVEPVFTDNKFTNFNPSDYPLSQTQKVKVVEQKFFPLQNYYNYIYALKSKQEIFKLAEVTQKKANQIIKKQTNNRQDYVSFLDNGYQNQPLIKETKKIKGQYQSRFNSQGKRGSKLKEQELGPVYLEFKEGRRQVNPFGVKQAQRQKILNDFSERYFMK